MRRTRRASSACEIESKARATRHWAGLMVICDLQAKAVATSGSRACPGARSSLRRHTARWRLGRRHDGDPLPYRDPLRPCHRNSRALPTAAWMIVPSRSRERPDRRTGHAAGAPAKCPLPPKRADGRVFAANPPRLSGAALLLSVALNGVLDAGQALLQIGWAHHRDQLDLGIQTEEQPLRDVGDLR